MIGAIMDWFYDHEGFSFFLIVVLLVAAVFGIVMFALMAECSQVENISDRYTEYHFIGGCFVEVNNELIPLDAWYEVSNSR